jgi:hypothetical protein
MKLQILWIACLLTIGSAFSQQSILPLGSSWKYLDNGTNQGTNWRGTSFNDASWKTGNAQLGYGDGDEATIVSFGSNAKKKYMATYFRKVVSITNPSQFISFTLGLKRDDGAVVYINGTERFRSNMPTGTISYTTRASSSASDDGNTLQTVNLSSSFFVNGNNTIAVEVHQFNGNDPDLSFDLQLVANANLAPVANAGPDQTITLPSNSVTLNGSASGDPDGTIASWAWTQLSGPNTANISFPGNVSTSVNGLVQGSYSFQLTVTDNSGATATDVVAITVTAAVNLAPVANAGPDQTITLPSNTVTLNGSASGDPDGTIASWAWTQLSGPNTANISFPGNVSTTVNGLVQGNYTFQLSVTDNNGRFRQRCSNHNSSIHYI